MGTFNANILPTQSGLDLGNSSQRWDVFAKDFDIAGTTTFAPKILGGIRFADQFSGVDIGAKITAAIADLASTGGIVDARGFEGSQSCSTNPFSGLTALTKPITLLLGAVTINTTAAWKIACQNLNVYGTSYNESVICYTGTGTVNYVVGFDAGDATINGGAGLWGNRIARVSIVGNTHNTDALAIINNHHVIVDDVELWGCTRAGLYVQGSITSQFRKIHVSSSERLMFALPNLQTPVNGIIFDTGTWGSSTYQVTDSDILGCAIEGVSSTGIWLKSASSNLFTGTSEGNGGAAVVVDSPCSHNTFIGMDCESNGGTYDFSINGTDTKLLGVIAISQTPSILVNSSAVDTVIDGGNINGVTDTGSNTRWTYGNRTKHTRKWVSPDNSMSLGWNKLAGQGEADYHTNVYTSATSFAHAWWAPDSGQTTYVQLAGLLFNGQLQLLTNTIGKYNGITTVSNGVPTEYATVDLTAQTAAVGTTTLYAVPAAGAGQYRISWNAKVTTAAGTSSTLGALTITYTDPDGVVQTITAGAQTNAGAIATTSAGNTTTTVLLGLPMLLNCKASTNIQYAFAYASNAANAMNYNLHIKLEAL